MAEETKLNQV